MSNGFILLTALINWVKANTFWLTYFGIMVLFIIMIVAAVFWQPIIELLTGA